MTLIAGISNFSYPIVMGDLLTSSSKFNKDFKLPTFLKGVEEYISKGTKIYPAKLIQKTYIIKNNLIVSIAGNYSENKEFITSIKKEFENQDCNEITLVSFLEKYDQNKFVNSSYLFQIFEEKKQGTLMISLTVGKYWKKQKSNLFGEIYATGTGAEDFINEINRYENIYGIGDIDSENKALSLNLILISSLLATESFSLETIKKFWGAGFELVSFNEKDKTFYKIDELTYIIWRGSLNKKTQKLDLNPYLVLSYKYFDEILLINSYNNNKYERFGVLPINLKKEDINLEILPKNIDFYNKTICNTFLIDLPNGKISTPSILCHKDNEQVGEVFINLNEENKIEIGISEKVTNEIFRQLNNI